MVSDSNYNSFDISFNRSYLVRGKRMQRTVRKGKYANHYYCNSHKWVLKSLCLKVQLKSGLMQTRCPYCRRPMRENPRASEFKEIYLNVKRY